MSDIITTLKVQHVELLKVADELSGHLREQRLGEVSPSLTRLKRALVAHLAVEDSKLYPALIQSAQRKGDSNSEQIAVSMGRISQALLAFLQKYEGRDFDLAAFKRDWNGILALVGSRIEAEERTLFPMYERS